MAGRTYKKTEIQAFAKINFSLNVTGTDSRKYHTLESIMQTVPIYDSIVVTSVTKGGTPPKNFVLPGRIPINLSTDMRFLPTDSRNTAYRAAETMCRRYPSILAGSEDISISIRKKIPVGGGLGGSSADCAAVIKAFNIHFDLGLQTEELIGIGAELGSDVPFMIEGGTALVTGTGEIVEKLPAPEGLPILLCFRNYGMDTWEVYRKYDEIDTSGIVPADTAALKDALLRGDNDAFVSGLANMLETPAFLLKKELGQFKARLERLGARKVLMSGSGSSFFCVFSKDSEAKAAMQELMTEGVECMTVRI